MRSKIVAQGMLRINTPVEDYREEFGLWVKREDLACPVPGPPFSKTRGVYKHVKKRREKIIGVLDTRHSQAGHAVARACQILGKKCINYYPEFIDDIRLGSPLRDPQVQAKKLGAELHALPAGRSAILFHAAKKLCEGQGGYMMPNALKLPESVDETAKEVTPNLRHVKTVLVPISSGTIAAGVVKGFLGLGVSPTFLIHLGYSRSYDKVARYIRIMSGVPDVKLHIIDEGYNYKDVARTGPTPPWPCNEYYDLKAFRWWTVQDRYPAPALLWNIG